MTTHAVRAEIKRSTALAAELGRPRNINPKTVRKWRQRALVEDEGMGSKASCSSSLTEAEEAADVTFRRTTYLLLDDCLFALQRFIPHLTRSKLHRLNQRHDLSRLLREAGSRKKGQTFRATSIGYLHLDICEIRIG